MKNNIEDIKRQIVDLFPEEDNKILEPLNNDSLEAALSYTEEQYLEIKIGLEQVYEASVFSAKEVIDSLR